MMASNCAHYNPTFQFDLVKNKNGMLDFYKHINCFATNKKAEISQNYMNLI